MGCDSSADLFSRVKMPVDEASSMLSSSNCPGIPNDLKHARKAAHEDCFGMLVADLPCSKVKSSEVAVCVRENTCELVVACRYGQISSEEKPLLSPLPALC